MFPKLVYVPLQTAQSYFVTCPKHIETRMTKPMWKIAAEKGGRIFDLFKEERLVAMGLEGVGDISSLSTRKQVAAKVQEAFPKWPQGRVAVWAGMLLRFQHKIALEDYVITYDPGRRKYLIGTIASECRFDPGRIPGDPLLRQVKWEKEINRDDLSQAAKNSLGAISTLFRAAIFRASPHPLPRRPGSNRHRVWPQSRRSH